MCLKYKEVDKTSGDFVPKTAADRLAHTDNEYINPETGTSVPDWKRDRGETTNEWRRRKRLAYDERRNTFYNQFDWNTPDGRHPCIVTTSNNIL